MARDLLLSREEVLGGLPARRAQALLFLIESRTAQLVERSRQTMQRIQSEEIARERELSFIEAFAMGREPPLRPTIQDLERHAPDWSGLVPDNPRIRAALAHLLGKKYAFTSRATPQLREAIALDSEPVQQAYRRQYGDALDSIYAAREPITTRLRWRVSALAGRLESLPSFWTAFALTLTETVGAGILALPIALAGVGPIPGIVLLIIFGVLNTISIAWVAESATRTASVRYGGAYFGRMVTEYLGNAGGLLLTVSLAIIATTMLMAYAIGLSSTLASITGVGAMVWIALHFVIVFYMTSRETLNSTVASALAIGAVNLALLIVLTALGLIHFDIGNLDHVHLPGIDGAPFDASVLALIFGVILSAYFGHTSVGNCAAVVLRRDASGRSLIWGVVAAQIVAITAYSSWILAINGSISADALAGYTGTALDPLADVAGPVVYGFGSIFVVLAMGMGAIHMALGLINITRERLPRRAQPVVALPRGQGRLVFVPRGRNDQHRLRLVVSYLGFDGGQPHYRLRVQDGGAVHVADHRGNASWNVTDDLTDVSEEARHRIDLIVETLHAEGGIARVRVSTSMSMAFEGSWTTTGLDVLSLLDDRSGAAGADTELTRWLLRQGTVDLAAVASWLDVSEGEAAERLRQLIEQGQVREIVENGETRYRASVARRRARSLPGGLQPDQVRESSVTDRGRDLLGGVSGWLLEGRGRRVLESLPLLAVFLLTEWLVLTDQASFSGVLGLTGVIAVPIFAGVFPAMLLVASRRKGELVPGVWYRRLGMPSLVWGVGLVFLLGIVLHGLIIWEDPLQRIAAFAATFFSTAVVILAMRRGAFRPRTVVSLREDQRLASGSVLEIVAGGDHHRADVRVATDDGTHEVHGGHIDLPPVSDLRSLTVALDAERPPASIRVWANRVTPEGLVESLPATLHLGRTQQDEHVDLRVAGGIVDYPPEGACTTIEVAMEGPPKRDPDAALADLQPGRGRRRRSTLTQDHA